MSTPIVICDDSSFARKQLVLALPDGCDVDITFAKDGQEALKAVQSSKPKLMFLDLNMPIMDGYQTLQAMRQSGLTSNVIVVSGDIQPEAHKRVIELGARAFIKKPVDKSEIAKLLQQHGIKSTPKKTRRKKSSANTSVKTDVRSGCQEIANVAMGRATDLLARLLGAYINMPIPNVNDIEKNELLMALKYVDQAADVSAVCQGFIGAGIAGEALLIFNDSSFSDMAELMNYQGLTDEALELELLMDISSILFSAFLKGIAEQLDIHFSQGQPMVLGRHINISDLLKRNSARWDRTLAIETSFSFENRDISCELLFLFTEDSIDPLNELVSCILSE